MQVVSAANVRVVVLGPPCDELLTEAELLHEPDAALLAREKAVGPGLDRESVDVLGAKLPTGRRVALDQDDLGA